MQADQRRVHVGTSGWCYGHWREAFYPAGMAAREWLAYYAARLDTVEVNSSFYRLPAPATLRAWGAVVPADFIFSVKASRFITHLKKLRDPAATLPPFLARVDALKPRLGPILFQLPPRWRLDLDRLRGFLARLPEGFRYAFEFRDPSWWTEAVYEVLGSRGAAFCIHQLAGARAPGVVTCDFVYVRLHGPEAAYRGRYDEASLAAWADACREWAARGLKVYCYFDNDQAGYAAHNAVRMWAMLGQGVAIKRTT